LLLSSRRRYPTANPQIEITRQVLAEQEGFAPYTAFRRIAQSSKEGIDSSGLASFLKQNGLKVGEEEIHEMVKEHDKDRDGFLNY